MLLLIASNPATGSLSSQPRLQVLCRTLVDGFGEGHLPIGGLGAQRVLERLRVQAERGQAVHWRDQRDFLQRGEIVGIECAAARVQPASVLRLAAWYAGAGRQAAVPLQAAMEREGERCLQDREDSHPASSPARPP